MNVNFGDNEEKGGFTLVELLIVVGIISILAAIAIPQFMSYSSRAVMASMVADAKNTISQEAAYYTEYNAYADANVGPGPARLVLPVPAPGVGNSSSVLSASKGNTITVAVTGSVYVITVSNSSAGTGKNPLTFHSGGGCSWADGSAC